MVVISEHAVVREVAGGIDQRTGDKVALFTSTTVKHGVVERVIFTDDFEGINAVLRPVTITQEPVPFFGEYNVSVDVGATSGVPIEVGTFCTVVGDTPLVREGEALDWWSWFVYW